MKTRFFTFMALAAAFVGCAKETVDSTVEKEFIPLTFECEFVNEDKVEAKSYLEEETIGEGEEQKTYQVVTWHANDKIAIVPVSTDGNDYIGYLTGENYFTTVEGGKEATFTGTSVAADQYVGVYPASGTDYLDVDNGIVYKDLFENQKATLGNIGMNDIPAVTKPTAANEKLYFYNACALIKFTIPKDLTNITKVSFRGGNSEKLAGRIVIKYSEDENISVWVAEAYDKQNSQYTISVSNEDGSALTAGGTYYMVSAPSKLNNGFTVVMYGADGKRYIKSTEKANELHRSKVMNLGTLDATEDSPAHENLYLISEGAGWTFDPLTKYPLNSFIFRYGGYIKNGQIKFGTQSGMWTNNYKAFADNVDCFTNEDAMFVEGESPDNKWLLITEQENGVPCRIVMDITTGIEKMYMNEFADYSAICMIGDATPSGWDISGTQLQKVEGESFTWSWTGDLNVGEIKFTLNNNTDWLGGEWLMAPTNGNSFEDSDILYINLGEYPGIDYKWKVAAGGNYTITINTLTEKITIVKNENSEESAE